MRTKIKKIIFEYSKNSRITTKELGKNIGASQQSASYLLKSLKKKKFIAGNTTIADLVEYATKNLSAFNKIHSDIIYKFFTKLKSKFVFPLIVSHEYHKNYLSKKLNNSDIILSG